MTDNKRIVTFGELLLRFSKSAHRRFTQREELLGNFGGSEANAAVLCAALGLRSVYVTKLPDNRIGSAARADRCATHILRYDPSRRPPFWNWTTPARSEAARCTPPSALLLCAHTCPLHFGIALWAA